MEVLMNNHMLKSTMIRVNGLQSDRQMDERIGGFRKGKISFVINSVMICELQLSAMNV